MVTLWLFLGCSPHDPGGAESVSHDSPPSDESGDTDTAPDDTSGPDDTSETGDSGAVPVDADGDGAFTPDDCDDANPAVFPGAYDWCDGVDQDCDGSPQGDGACGEVGVWSELDVGWWEGTEAYMRFGAEQPAPMDSRIGLLGSLNGLHNEFVDTDWNAIVALEGMPGADPNWQTSAVGVWAAEEWRDHLSRGMGAGDFNGDGEDDIWVVSEGQSGCCDGGAFLILGPSERWPKDGAYIRDVADGWWMQARENDNFGGDEDAGGDIDGDGLPDGVFLAWGDIWDGTGGSLHVIRGRTDPLPPGGGSIADEITLWKSDGRVDDASWVRIGADLDGDGSREILLDAPDHGLGVVAGDDVAAADGGTLADWITVIANDAGAFPGIEFARPAVPGDVDGDGLDEIVLVYQNLPEADGDESCYAFVSGEAAISGGALGAGTVATACVDANATGAEYLGEDVDEDGIRDLVASWDTEFSDALGNAYDDDYLTCILPSSRLALGGRVEVRDVSLCYVGAVGSTADIDGDGLPELVFAPEAPVTTLEQAGRTDVLPGFSIPWDNPAKW
jgi:hypothetical protein